jgi:hypothetical protein
MNWELTERITSILVNVTVLFGAAAAVIKFRLFNVLAHKWQSELTCRHHQLSAGNVVFEANYTVRNFGQRPLEVNSVHIRLLAARIEGGLLWPDDSRCLAERMIPGLEADLAGNLDVQPGERTIFTLRCLLDSLDEVVFVVGTLELPQRRVPAVFRTLYLRDAAQGQGTDGGEAAKPA